MPLHMADDRQWMRATVNLTGVTVGQIVHVNPNAEYIAKCIARGYLVPCDPPEGLE